VIEFPEPTLRRYLLGQLGEEECERIERALVADAALGEELEAIEEELYFEFAEDTLPPEERERFERRQLATPGGRARLARIRELRAELASARLRGAPSGRLLAAAAALVVAAGAAVVLVGRRPAAPGGEPPVATVEPRPGAAGAGVRAPAPEAPPDPGVTAPPSPAPLPALLALAPGALRGEGEGQRLRVAPETAVRLVLALPAGARAGERLRVEIVSAEGAVVWARSDLLARERGGGLEAVVELPAGALPEGDYQLELAREREGASEPIADYAFGLLLDEPAPGG
jgi:hypothetical protein